MNKKLLGLLAATFSMTFLSGCSSYQYKSGTLEEIAGTYKLKEITKKDENDADYSYKNKKGIEAYFSVDTSGYTYYAYKDDSTPWKGTQAFSIFTPDDEKEGYYKSIEITDGKNHQDIYYWNMEVGCMDEPPMGFMNSKSKTLSYTIHHSSPNALHKQEIPYQYVCYEKISDEVGVAGLNHATGQNFSFKMPFELGNVDGLYTLEINNGGHDDIIYNNPDYGRFEYGILDIASFNDNKMDFYYSLASDKVHTKTTATLTYADSGQLYRDAVLSFSVDDQGDVRNFTLYLKNGNALSSVFMYEVWSEPDDTGTSYCNYSNRLWKYYGDATTVDELIAELTAE